VPFNCKELVFKVLPLLDFNQKEKHTLYNPAGMFVTDNSCAVTRVEDVVEKVAKVV
jgi:hypothetical protein